MQNNVYRLTALFAVSLIGLHVLGFFLPTVFTWGFHVLGFLPAWMLFLYLVLAIAAVRTSFNGGLDDVLMRLSAFMEAKPVRFLAMVIALFVIVASSLRVQVPLLGDSFILIKIFGNAVNGAEYLPASHQPLAFFYFYGFMKLLGSFQFPDIMNAFLAGEIVLGIVFLASSFFTVRALFQNPEARLIGMLSICFLSALQLFFGYAEQYSAVLAALSVYILLVALYLHDKIPFRYLPVAFLLFVLIHYVGILTGLSLLFLAYGEFKRRGIREIAFGIGIMMIAVAAGLWALDFDDSRFMPPPRHIPVLSVVGIRNAYQPYAMVSPYHAIDLFNLLILLAPAGAFLIALTMRYAGRAAFRGRMTRFLLSALIPVGLFICIAQFDLPMAQDWDAFAPYAFPLILMAVIVAVDWLDHRAVRVFAILLPVLFLNSAAWWYLNSTIRPNIERVSKFIDTRISSHDGCYQSTLHLTEYALHMNDPKSIEQLSERFIELFPDDRRGYSNYTLYLMQMGDDKDVHIVGIFDKWMERDTTNVDARSQYADYLLSSGQRLYHEGKVEAALERYRAALRLVPTLAEAYNSSGIIYRDLGNIDAAIGAYETTIRLDPKSSYAYINLGNMYDDLGNSTEAVKWYRSAIGVDPKAASAYYNLGLVYAKLNERAQAVSALQEAARLGMADAQTLLTRGGERW